MFVISCVVFLGVCLWLFICCCWLNGCKYRRRNSSIIKNGWGPCLSKIILMMCRSCFASHCFCCCCCWWCRFLPHWGYAGPPHPTFLSARATSCDLRVSVDNAPLLSLRFSVLADAIKFHCVLRKAECTTYEPREALNRRDSIFLMITCVGGKGGISLIILFYWRP